MSPECPPPSALSTRYSALSSDDLIRPHQHVGRNRQADLLGRLEADHQREALRSFKGRVVMGSQQVGYSYSPFYGFLAISLSAHRTTCPAILTASLYSFCLICGPIPGYRVNTAYRLNPSACLID